MKVAELFHNMISNGVLYPLPYILIHIHSFSQLNIIVLYGSFFYYYSCARGTLWHLQNSYNKSLLNSLPPVFSFISSSLHSWDTFNRSHFSICTHVYIILPPYSPSYTPSPHPSHSHWYQAPRKDLFCFPFLWFTKKKSHFCLFKIARQDVYLWHFHV
jgi:hypothetical protein